MPRKFVDGAVEYARWWPGRVSVLPRRSSSAGAANLDEAPIDAGALPLDLALQDESRLSDALSSCPVVLATLVEGYLPLANQCLRLGTPLIYIAENSLRTRRQQIAAETRNLALRLRRFWYTTRMEGRYRAALRVASGVQCNGTPTFSAYRHLTPNPLLYFDTRAAEEMLIDPQTLQVRLGELAQGGPLRLAWSGRFHAIKGADHLIAVAAELCRLGVRFTLDLCGDGPLRHAMQSAVDRHQLREYVKFKGVLDFARELVPFISRHIDLFVCCHRQGDPSCTYMETLSCGVPIIGYANEAWTGLCQQSEAGWTTPLNQPQALARRIAQLDRGRASISTAARAACAFSAPRTFERVMKSRIDHLLQCCAGARAAPASRDAPCEERASLSAEPAP